MRRRILKECLRIAMRRNTPHGHSQYKHYPHFCFVVQDNKIVEWGMNSNGNADPVFGFSPKRHKWHAEIIAMRRARGLLNKAEGFEVINIRLNKTNLMRLSLPCKCCASMLKIVGCSKIHFTTDIGWAVA